MLSYKVGVISKSSNNDVVVHNGLRFLSEKDAEMYAAYLKLRWSDVKDTVVTACFEKPNSSFPVPSDRYTVERGKP